VSEKIARLQAELAALNLAYEALAERERRLLDFTEASGDWFWEQDETLRFTFISVREPGRGARALTPRLGDPMLGRTRFEQVLREPGDEAMWQRHAEDLAARRPFRDLTYRSRRGSDQPFWVRISGVPVFGRDGHFRGYRGVGRDVTAEMEAARAWTRQQALLRATLDRLPVGICLYDADQRLIWANRTYAVDAGVPSESFRPGMHLADVVRLLARQGWYGDVDIEAQVAIQLSIDRSRPSRRTRAGAQGRTFDVRFEPLPDGGHVVCTVDVSALVEAETQARRHALHLDMVLLRLRTGVCVYDANGRITLYNRRYEELLGLPDGMLRQGTSFEQHLRDLAARGEFAAVPDPEAYLARLMALDRTRPHLFRRMRPTGQVLDFTFDPLPDNGFMVSANDITALARAENDASARARLLDAILRALPHGVSVYGPDRRLAMVNPAYTQIMAGAPVAIGDHLEDVVRRRAEAGEFGPGDVTETFIREASRDVTKPQRRRRMRPNGTAIDIRTAPLPDGGHISVVTDITPVVEAEAEAMRRAGVLDTMLEHIRHGICLFDQERRVVAANRVAAQLLGHPPELLQPGRTQAELVSALVARGELGPPETAEAAARDYLTRDRSVSTIHWRTRPDGRVLEVRSDPTPDGGFVVTYTDVTEQKEAEAALRRAAAEAEAASRAKSQFLATMSHELRTPLNAVIGFSEALLHESAKPDARRIEEYAGAINEAGRHLLSLINDILDVARIEAGRMDLAEDRVDLARLAATALRLLEPVARTASVSLTLAVPQDLPAVQGDERRLRQVLLNLVSNAVKFTPPGGAVRLEAGFDAEGGIALRVADTGIGIAKEDLERVFQPFVQLDSSLSRRYQGSGLGLFLSRALAQAHGGTLILESEPGKGTTAVLRLPRARVLRQADAAQ
jgi:signal transduction histidine kinase